MAPKTVRRNNSLNVLRKRGTSDSGPRRSSGSQSTLPTSGSLFPSRSLFSSFGASQNSRAACRTLGNLTSSTKDTKLTENIPHVPIRDESHDLEAESPMTPQGTASTAVASHTEIEEDLCRQKAAICRLQRFVRKRLSQRQAAATQMQRVLRVYLRKRRAQEVERRREAYEKELNEAFAAASRAARRAEENRNIRKARKQADAKALKDSRKAAEADALQAAYGGDASALERSLRHPAGICVDCCNGVSNALLSEASNAGHLSIVELLLEKRADVNRCGEFNRTALWRATFMGRVDVMKALLLSGADPRMSDKAFRRPLDIATNEVARLLLQQWPEEETDRFWEEAEAQQSAWKEQQAVAAASKRRDRERRLQVEVDRLEEESEVCGRKLVAAHREWLQHRLSEEGFGRCRESLEMIWAQMQKAKRRLSRAMRAQHWEESNDAMSDSESDTEDLEAEWWKDFPCSLSVRLVDLNEVVIKDNNKRFSMSRRWPLVVDPSGQAAVFFSYCGGTYLSLWDAKHMEPAHIRKALLAAVKGGMPFVIDTLCSPVGLVHLKLCLEAVFEGLFESLISRAFIESEGWKALAEAEMNHALGGRPLLFKWLEFTPERLDDFRFVILSGCINPKEELLNAFYAIRICSDSL